MTDAIKRSLRESKAARWTALSIVSFTMMCGYFMTDVMAPLKPMLESALGWNSENYGVFTSAYGWFNVFFLMLFFGGLILDKTGVRFTGVLSTGLMVVGAVLKYWAVSDATLQATSWHFLWWTANMQVWMASLGFAIFGVGVEVAGITVTKIIVKWFHGKEMALAMGLQVAMARVGTLMAMLFSKRIADHFDIVSMPVLLALILLCIGLISFLAYIVMDIRLDRSESVGNTESAEDPFRLADIGVIFRSNGFWLIAILCVLFYSAVFPFLKYAPDLMVNKFHIEDFVLFGIHIKSGDVPAMLPMGTLILTPFFGNLYDRIGKGATIMIAGSLMILVIHALFSIPGLDHAWVALTLCILLGVAFSLVPSAMWPSVPKIIPHKQLGTAYSLIFWIQNWGLMGVPYLIGWTLDRHCIVGQKIVEGKSQNVYDYTLPMVIFTAFGLAALIVALLFKREDKRKKYGLEMPNIKK
ncbi:MAG: MFS transporter [Bacteroidales bacterium]|jgi:MFS family permease|nr:MFS transporter [Bacteroidales bacterium]